MTTHLYKLFAVVGLAFTGISCLAQSDQFSRYSTAIIKIDSISRKTTSPLPFDKAFILQYSLKKQESIDSFYIYKVDISRTAGRYIVVENNTAKCYNKTFIDTVWLSDSLLNIQIKYLPPNTLVDILVLKSLRPQDLPPFLEFNEKLYALHSKPLASQAGLQIKYNAIIESLSAKLYQRQRVVQKMGYTAYRLFFEDSLYKFYKNLHNNLLLKGVADLVFLDLHDIDTLFVKSKVSDAELVRFFRTVNSHRLPKVATGESRISYVNQADFDTAFDAFGPRIKNLEASIQTIDSLLFHLDQVILLNGTSAKLEAIKSLISTLRGRLQLNLDLMSSQYQPILDYTIGRKHELFREDWIMGGNDFSDLQQKSKFLLIPNLGLANIVANGVKQLYYFPRPFIGVSIYFRPVDKTLHESSIPYRDWRRKISLLLGLTYGDFGNSEFQNLFNDFSIIVGPSYRLNRTFLISAGAAFMKRTNENPVLAHTPFTASPFISFSFDLDILSNASSVESRILK